ncbi:unnamed protein product [Effrenium voratum]|nr:unnamed protein product [Effrenium voratum]
MHRHASRIPGSAIHKLARSFGAEGFGEWATTLDDHLAEITSSLPSGLDRLVLVPTGRMARADNGISEALRAPSRLAKVRQVATERGADLVVAPFEQEANIVRGIALASIFELQINQAQRALDGVLNDAQILQSLSKVQLHAIFDQMDVDGDGKLQAEELCRALTLLGFDRDVDQLVEELDTSHDGVVSFDEFMVWWSHHVNEARCVVTTSAKAWKTIITNLNPPNGFGPLVLLKVTFTFCRSCRSFEPKWRKYSQEYPEIRFVELVGNGTVGAMEFCTKQLGVKVSPAFFMFRRGEDGGEIVAQWTGASVERFEGSVKDCLEKHAAKTAKA